MDYRGTIREWQFERASLPLSGSILNVSERLLRVSYDGMYLRTKKYTTVSRQEHVHINLSLTLYSVHGLSLLSKSNHLRLWFTFYPQTFAKELRFLYHLRWPRLPDWFSITWTSEVLVVEKLFGEVHKLRMQILTDKEFRDGKAISGRCWSPISRYTLSLWWQLGYNGIKTSGERHFSDRQGASTWI